MPPRRKSPRALQLVAKPQRIEFDAGLEQACRLAADDVARELGRQAARDAIDAMTNDKAEAS